MSLYLFLGRFSGFLASSMAIPGFFLYNSCKNIWILVIDHFDINLVLEITWKSTSLITKVVTLFTWKYTSRSPLSRFYKTNNKINQLTNNQYLVVHVKKNLVTGGIFTVYHKKASHNYFYRMPSFGGKKLEAVTDACGMRGMRHIMAGKTWSTRYWTLWREKNWRLWRPDAKTSCTVDTAEYATGFHPSDWLNPPEFSLQKKFKWT